MMRTHSPILGAILLVILTSPALADIPGPFPRPPRPQPGPQVQPPTALVTIAVDTNQTQSQVVVSSDLVKQQQQFVPQPPAETPPFWHTIVAGLALSFAVGSLVLLKNRSKVRAGFVTMLLFGLTLGLGSYLQADVLLPINPGPPPQPFNPPGGVKVPAINNQTSAVIHVDQFGKKVNLILSPADAIKLRGHLNRLDLHKQVNPQPPIQPPIIRPPG